jgi:hypothetical protein
MDIWTAVATALAGVLVGGFVTYVLQRARLSYEDCRAAVERDWAAVDRIVEYVAETLHRRDMDAARALAELKVRVNERAMHTIRDAELRTLVRVFGEMALRDHQATQGRQSEGEEALWGRHLEAIYARLIARGNDCRLWASIVTSSA